MQLDDEIGTVMAKLEELGIADDTIVIFTTDNGPEHSTYPEGGTTPFRSEKMSTWEGGSRVPFVIRWPDHIEARTEVNGIQTLMDVFATLASAAGVDYEDLRQRLMGGDDLGTGTVKTAYLDGIDMSDYWADPSQDSPRDNYIYWAESSINALRVNQWKAHFRLRDGYCATTEDLEIVRVYNIRHDPFESFDQYPRILGQLPQHKSWTFNTILGRISEHLATWQQYPPAQRGSSLSTNQLVDQLLEQQKGAKAHSRDLRLRCPRGPRGRCEPSQRGDPAWRRRKRELLAGAGARRLTPPSKELRGALVAHGHGFGYGTIRRFIRRHARARKSARAGEQDRAS